MNCHSIRNVHSTMDSSNSSTKGQTIRKTKKASEGQRKKDPKAPKRFRSAYILFAKRRFQERKKQFAQEGIQHKTIDVSKMVAEDWRDLHPTDRQVYEEMARKDKARYQAEKELYKGPWTVPKYRKESNDATAPKRPPSAFIAFSNERRSMVKARMKEATNSGVSKLLSIMWRSAPETIKSRYQVEEKRLREKYMEEIAEWRIKQAEQMKKRQEDAMKIVEGLQSKFEPDTLQSQDTRAYRRVGASQKEQQIDANETRVPQECPMIPPEEEFDDDIGFWKPHATLTNWDQISHETNLALDEASSLSDLISCNVEAFQNSLI